METFRLLGYHSCACLFFILENKVVCVTREVHPVHQISKPWKRLWGFAEPWGATLLTRRVLALGFPVA